MLNFAIHLFSKLSVIEMETPKSPKIIIVINISKRLLKPAFRPLKENSVNKKIDKRIE